MKRNALSIAIGVLIVILLLAIRANTAHADTLQFCSPTGASAQSVMGPNGYTTTVNATTTLTPGACAVTPPPSTGTGIVACNQAAATDVTGYKLACAGTYILHTPIDVQRGPAAYSWKFVFGNNVNEWPGGPFGTSEIFTLSSTQALAIPFLPTTDNTITLSTAQTYTPHPITVAISTKPGVFNNGAVGNGVVCIAGARGLASLKITTNGAADAQCKLTKGVQYWAEALPAVYLNGAWTNFYSGDPAFKGQAKFGFTVYSIN